jgi:hypothetical protein
MTELETIQSNLSQPQTGNLNAVLDAVLDLGCRFAGLHGELGGDGIVLRTSSSSDTVAIPRAQYTFRIMLAGLYGRAEELTGQSMNPYQNQSEFPWKGKTLRLTVRNELRDMHFDIEMRTANNTSDVIVAKRAETSR